jgi:hypothetical protein
MSNEQNNAPEIITDEMIKEARARLWEQGILQWKLGITQKKIYDFYNNSTDKTIVVNASRRLGKSYYLTVMAIEQCLKHPKSIVKMLQPEVKMVRTNIRPIMNEILEDCPESLRPTFKTQDNMYVFPNGSEIHLAGTDNGNYEKIRGGQCHLAIVDEAGFCSDLDQIIKFILIPTTLLTGGKIILSSTTPPNPDHEFVKAMEQAALENRLIRKTIFDAESDDRGTATPRITDKVIADIVKSYPGGVDNEAFRTEFMCEVIYNSKDAVVPEFTEDVQKDCIVNWPRPVFYDRYTTMDIGFEDLTVLLYGYWDFDNGVLVIEDETVINGPEMTTSKLADLITKKENSLWTNHLSGEFQPPYLRVSDNNLILINDLQKDYGLTFMPTDKHNKDAFINQMRNMIQARQIIISPKCKTLISHLKSATWDKSRKSYKRSPDNGHYDAVDALAYLVRNIDQSRNPYPRGYKYSKLGTPGNVFINPNAKDQQTQSYEKLSKMFERKSSFKLKK